MAADLQTVRAEAESLLGEAPEEPGLDARTVTVLDYAVASATTALDAEALRARTAAALEAGVEPQVLVEVLQLVSALGMHTLHEGLIELGRHVEPPDRDVGDLRARREQPAGYWARFEQDVPGFMDLFARWSPEGYEAFLDYCATPVRSGSLSKLERELLWLSIDATPTHRYVPGLRFHVACAVKLGASRRQVLEALDRAAAGPPHTGVARHST
jgi:alkylhydroperoxidase/carboxymuconolactone decarboxylase family protein YurZ